MNVTAPLQLEARLADIRRQKLHLEQLVELEQEERRLMALQGGATVGHLPTPAHIAQTTEMRNATPARAATTVDLTTPPPKLEPKLEPKQETEDSPAPVPADVGQDLARLESTPSDSDDVPIQRRRHLKRRRDETSGHVPANSPPPTDLPDAQPQEAAAPNGRPTKKRTRAEGPFTPVVDDEEYRTIIKARDGGDGVVEVTCKFCGANCAVYSGVKLLFRGIVAWRSHISVCHRNELPAGTKLKTKYVVDNCLSQRILSPEEELAVLNHKHDEFVVVKKVGPGAEPGSGPRKARKKRGSHATGPSGMEDEAERDLMLGAFDDPNDSDEPKEDLPPPPKLKLRNRLVGKDSSGIAHHTPDADETPAAGDLNEDPDTRTFTMSTRKGGRRTMRTPDYVSGKVE